MGKHGRNQTANPVYTYHERQKDKKQQKYGRLSQRLGADSMREVDCCYLSLQPVVDAVITPDGYLFEREAILENLLHQKQETARKKRAYELQLKKEKEEEKELQEAAKRDQVTRFKSTESSIAYSARDHFKTDNKKGGHATAALEAAKKFTVKRAKGDVNPDHPAFWVPSATPDAKSSKLTKPDTKTRCPITNKPLKLKQLIPVKFTQVNPDSKQPIVAREDRYMCPVTRTSFKGNIQLVAIKPTGRVVSQECIDKIVRKDMRDPISGEPLTEADLIPLKKGASGFAASGHALQASKQNATQTVT
ncbi:hypothetical protein PTSG_07686 [Salpingoeca rosetta]|uniref:Nitric oxide synthase-interacting protein zinc-finger domain-containing protein n=1 Tax=Salpingoeca rosetta (strain ATCC 50818 / BSB-021) TaxID=946362 RepID=F2UHH0_SALR5|nr:uncharacterized protein PTSG_07686 [Salpingoeca rosetta]EGD76569.1 hypothetical protein PTSG_07686 [Salpingoeca rosetta]|eukprot:XP_004991483.1 hypothetical protein PTSG_07686 [Salpingoeca rosetta]